MASPINTSVMPGDNMDPDAIETAAGNMRSVGTTVSTRGASVLSTWQGLSAHYHAPEQATLFTAMNPVKTNAEAFGTDVSKVATALGVFAEEVRAIKKAVADIRADAAALLGTIHDGKVTVQSSGGYNPYTGAGSLPDSHDVDWDSDAATVAANNKLIQRTNDQQEALWAAERKCANAINDISGQPRVDPVTDQSGGQGYGVTEIPDNAQMPWGGAVERKEGCGEKVVKGVIIDGGGAMLNGLGNLVGVNYSGEEGWSWK